MQGKINIHSNIVSVEAHHAYYGRCNFTMGVIIRAIIWAIHQRGDKLNISHRQFFKIFNDWQIQGMAMRGPNIPPRHDQFLIVSRNEGIALVGSCGLYCKMMVFISPLWLLRVINGNQSYHAPSNLWSPNTPFVPSCTPVWPNCVHFHPLGPPCTSLCSFCTLSAPCAQGKRRHWGVQRAPLHPLWPSCTPYIIVVLPCIPLYLILHPLLVQ